jgi:hypothetical protein
VRQGSVPYGALATVRRAIDRMPQKSFVSGLVASAWYAGSCALLFGQTIPFGFSWFALVIGVFPFERR